MTTFVALRYEARKTSSTVVIDPRYSMLSKHRDYREFEGAR